MTLPTKLLVPQEGSGRRSRSGSNSSLDTTSLTDEETFSSLTISGHKTGGKHHLESPSSWLFIRVSPQFIIVTMLLLSSLAFILGTICHIIILSKMGVYNPMQTTNNNMANKSSSSMGTVYNLPTPVLRPGKDVPPTTFLSKIFHQHQDAAITSHTVHLDRKVTTTNIDHDEEKEEVEEEYKDHHPTGQHLLLDMKNVDPTFLNSEERLAAAMVELASAAHVTLLSYHCHQLVPMGVSCIGVLLESHVAFHTWPKEGVISMDFFTCGSGLLIPLLPTIKKLFGIPSQNNNDHIDPQMIWSHKLRGFRPHYVAHDNPYDQDLGAFLESHNMELKDPLASEETDFQYVDIYEYLDPRGPPLSTYEKSITDDGSYESLNREFYSPDKMLFLDGVQQSSLQGEASYHEALVHPAMLAHSNPKRVAIIGGGEGATLREVLKHKTVEQVVMVDIDEELVEMCREHLPEWSDCSNIEGSDADSCFDDSRASVHFEDAFAYFIDRFGGATDSSGGNEADKFDVIIMDALDPDKAVDIVGNLYTGSHFADSLYHGLSHDGVFVVQIGESDRLAAPAVDTGQSKDKANLITSLQTAGFQSMHTYDEGHSEFDAPWAYLVCLKDYKSRANWYRTAPDINIQLLTRLHKTKSGKPILHVFDAATMISYQVPTKAQETLFCRSDDAPDECDEYGFGDDDSIVPVSHLKAGKSTVNGEYGGRGLFAAQDIPKYAMLNVEGGVKAFHVLPSTWAVFEPFYEWADESSDDDDGIMNGIEDELSRFYAFTEGYGYKATVLGKKHFTIDSSITTFCNHGCNGTTNYGDKDKVDLTETNADLNNPHEDVLTKAVVYSPVMERHLRQHLSIGDYTLRDIKKDEEILCDYLTFVGDPDDWKEEVKDLQDMCAGELSGDVSEYEMAHQS